MGMACQTLYKLRWHPQGRRAVAYPLSGAGAIDAQYQLIQAYFSRLYIYAHPGPGGSYHYIISPSRYIY